ncbi:leucine-rich repeat domain-containing protein [Caloramator sp. CAR-1]|uniref:leucine-rich repeat domain-containing protein n=1 Tax=Caloramator sp. CAR-1 TaxID=3062777 RepID=UPI0026E337A4|nr:leucine-rich repeat domain-containing protein [Caloramator sp. CAR-1]MDO6355571.1 leucine-rich repeat domain-containing protein [Caloramator sp. CAR-1]
MFKEKIDNLFKSRIFNALLIIYAFIFIINASITIMYPERFRAKANYENKIAKNNVAADDGLNPIIFKDKNLERTIRSYIGKGEGEVYVKDVAGITELDLRFQGVETIEDLRFFKSLKKLNISNNNLRNLNGLENLKGLEKIIAYENNIEDVSALANVKSLKYLDLANNQIKDAKPLTNLLNLEVLNLSANRIEKIDGFENLKNLKELDLSQNRIKDFTPIRGLNIKLLFDWGNK